MGRHRQGAAIALTLCICTSPAPAKAAATVNSDGYVRIHATLQVGDEDSRDGGDRPKVVTLTECLPDFKQYDFKALLKSSQQLDVGIAFDLPEQKEVQLNPIVMAKSADFWASNLPFWFSPTCTTVLDRIDYRSPLFLAATYADRPFQVALRRKDSAQLDPGVIAATDALWSAVAPLSKLPAGLTKIINIDAAAAALGTSNDDMERFSLQLDTQAAVAGAIPLPQARIVTLSSTSSILKRDVTIKVEMEAVQSIFPFPPAGGWQPESVLRTNFPVASTVQTTSSSDVRHFMTGYLDSSLTDYVSAQDLVRAEAKCESIESLLDAMALSQRDEALILWAEVRQNAKFRNDPAALDALDCLKDRWDSLKAIGVARIEPPAPPAQPAAVAPSVDNMIAAATNGEALANFFEAPTWEDRRDAAAGLFAYPMSYAEDGTGILRDGETQLNDADGWTGLNPQRDRQYLSHFGCYVPLAPDTIAKLGLDAELGAGTSTMLAVGELPRRKQAFVLAVLKYAPRAPAAQISSVRFSAAPSAKEKAAMLSVWKHGYCGETHLRPGFLFGR